MFYKLLTLSILCAMFSLTGLAKDQSIEAFPTFKPYDNTTEGKSTNDWEFSTEEARQFGKFRLKRFFSVDRFAHKYTSLTPYHYVANSPANFIDVNGDSIWINYTDDDGNDQRFLYTQGMEYNGNNNRVATLIGSLNRLNSLSSGNIVLTRLSGSTAHYNLGLSGEYGGVYNRNAIQRGAGGNIGVANPGDIVNLSEELFHGFQHDQMDMTNSTAFEIGAKLFSGHIEFETSGMVTAGIAGGSQEFADAYINLIYNQQFNQTDFNTATRTFLESGYNPRDGNGPNYDNLRPQIINNPPISQFYPLVRF